MSSAKEDTQNSKIVFCDDGGRPVIDEADHEGEFYPNDWVRIINPKQEGRFKVTEVLDGRYRLQDENGVSVEQGRWFEESELELEE
ncbi:unnamed protein product [Alternaria alternata]